MKQTIIHNAKVLRQLHKALHDTFLRRSESSQAREAWQKAREEFQRRWDSLAFPGGAAMGLEKLSQGDLLTAETSIQYLEVRPYVFRSQYLSKTLIQKLKKLPLRPDLQQRFEDLLTAARERKLKRSGLKPPAV